MSTKRVVVIEGEDAAPEAVRPTVQLVDQLGLDIKWLRPPVGEEGLTRCGSLFPDECRAAIDASDATLFGATSGKSVPALFYLRWGKGTYANVRRGGCRVAAARWRGPRESTSSSCAKISRIYTSASKVISTRCDRSDSRVQ